MISNSAGIYEKKNVEAMRVHDLHENQGEENS
jgi:hypothetical protein